MTKKSSSKQTTRETRRPLRSVRTRQYKAMLAELPESIQRRAAELYKLFAKDPNAPVLETENLVDRQKGRHRHGSKSVRITLRYRAIYVIDNGPDGKGERQACWYWIGSHESCNNFIGSSG